MDVVVHQAVGHQPRLELLRVMRQTPEVLPPIRVVPEDRFPLVAPTDHVVQPPSHLTPQRPRHLAIVPTYKTDTVACSSGNGACLRHGRYRPRAALPDRSEPGGGSGRNGREQPRDQSYWDCLRRIADLDGKRQFRLDRDTWRDDSLDGDDG